MKDFFGSKFENENAGNMHDFSVRVPARVPDWVEHAACSVVCVRAVTPIR